MPLCFISYAWGDPEHELWVESRLATDLRNAPLIEVLLDQWHGAKISSSSPRFVERIDKSDFIIVVGTPAYLRKYKEAELNSGSVSAAEVDLINCRLVGTTEGLKETVLTILRSGERDTSFPPLLKMRTCADFRDEDLYYPSLLDLILTIHGRDYADPAIAGYRRKVKHGTGV